MAQKKSNFSQTIKKLWNEDNQNQGENLNQYLNPEDDIKPTNTLNQNDASSSYNSADVSQPYYKAVPEAPMEPEIDHSDKTFISKGTLIDGNIRSTSSMSISGDIKGNIETTKEVELSGTIVGNIKCSDLAMSGASMQGNILTRGEMVINRDTIVIGNVDANEANINGKLKGNLNISGKTILKEDAVVFGDINASTISIIDGAVVQGYINTTYLNQEDNAKIFPEKIELS